MNSKSHMRRQFEFAIMGFIIFLVVTSVSAHLCHDPFRPRERIVLVPEKDLIRIEEEGEFRMYIENTFRSVLRDVQLFVENPALEVQVKPTVLKNLSPGERAFFLIKLKLREGFAPGNYPLRISVGARSAELRPSIEKMVVGIEKEKVEPEIEQERPLLPKKEPKPTKEEVTPQEEKVEVQQEAGEVVVEVEKIPFWKKPYFYIILILSLLAILIWRKIK